MSLTSCLLGVAFLSVLILGIGGAVVTVRRRLLGRGAGATGRVVETVLALSAVPVMSQLSGVAHCFGPPALLGGCAAIGAATWLVARGRDDARADAAPGGRRAPLHEVGISTGVGVLVAGEWGASTPGACRPG